MTGPLNFPSPALSQSAKNELSKKLEFQDLVEHSIVKKTNNWHLYYTNPPDNTVPHWARCASWVHLTNNAEFAAVFNLSGRNISGAVRVVTVMNNGVLTLFKSSLSKEGHFFDVGFIAQLRTEAITLNGNAAIKVSLWIKHASYQINNYVSAMNVGGFRHNEISDIKLDYKDDITNTTPPNPLFKEIDYWYGGFNAVQMLNKTPLVMLNGFVASTSHPLSVTVDNGGVTLDGIIKTINEDGTASTTANWTALTSLPVVARPKRTARHVVTMGNGFNILVVSTNGNIQFVNPITADVDIHVEYKV